MDAASCIAKLLADGGLAVQPTEPPGTPANSDWLVYIANMPDGPAAPDNCVCCANMVGERQGRLHQSGRTVIRPGVQIRVRGYYEEDFWEKIAAIESFLDTVVRRTVTVGSDSVVISSIRRHPAINMGREQGSRPRQHAAIHTIVTFL